MDMPANRDSGAGSLRARFARKGQHARARTGLLSGTALVGAVFCVAVLATPALADGGTGGSGLGHPGGAGGTGFTGQAGANPGTNGGGGGGGAGGGSGGSSSGPGAGSGGPGGTLGSPNGQNGTNASQPVVPAGGGGGGGGYNGNGAGTTTITNSSALSGGSGGSGGAASSSGDGGGGGGGAGGYGAIVTGSGATSNNSTISGGSGGAGGQSGRNGGNSGGNGGDGGVGVQFTTTGASFTNSGTITGGSGGAGGASNGGTVAGSPGAGGVGIVGSGLTIINSGQISGGLNGLGSPTPQANAITFTGGTNTLELRAGSVINGNVVASSSADTLALGGSTDTSFDVSQIGATAQYRGFGNFTKNGSSTWVLTGTNTGATPWTINNGTLAISQDASLGAASSALTFNGGTLQFLSSFSSSRNFTVGGFGGTFDTGTSGTNVTLSGTISGPGSLDVQGAGFLTLTGTGSHIGGDLMLCNCATGGLTISGGSLAVDGSSLGVEVLGGTLAVTNGGTLHVGAPPPAAAFWSQAETCLSTAPARP
jgi:hypothetical protein